jgi:hypothetical protein
VSHEREDARSQVVPLHRRRRNREQMVV